jgi:hypothetical protein
MKLSGQLHALPTLPQEKHPWQDGGRAPQLVQTWWEREKKSLPLPAIEPRLSSSQLIHCTDWAIDFLNIYCIKEIKHLEPDNLK